MLDFKVKEGAENMLIPSTAGSSILTKSPIRKKSILQWRTQFKTKQVKPQSMPLSYFPRFHHHVISAKYGFDSLILTDANMQVLNGYISYVRPLLNPQCAFVLVNRKGGQHGKLGEIMSKLVFDAIGKYIHPTRYRQIVETESLNQLTSEEQRPETQFCCC